MSLGREIAPPVSIGRPPFKHYPAPASGAILAIPFAAIAVWGFTSFRGAASPGFYWFLTISAALLVLMSIVTTLFWLRFGVTISLREHGVVIGTRGEEHQLRYADIDSITIRDKRRFDEKLIVRVLTRTLLIESSGATVKAQYVAPPHAALDEHLDAIAERVAAERRPREGDGWRIDGSTTLHLRDTMVPLSTISAAGVFGHEVRLWKNRETHHFFAVPYDSKNARVLLAIASSSTSTFQTAQPIVEAAPSSGIGRLLFARRTSISSVLGNTIMTAFVVTCAWGLSIRFAPRLLPFFPGIAIGVGVLWLFYAIYRLSVRYRFHERAVTCISLLGTRTLLYANVASMRWRETITTVNSAIPAGASVKASLAPDDGSPSLVIKLHRYRGTDGDLEPLRSAIAHHIAERWQQRLERGEEVPWTKHLAFTSAGLRLKREIVRYDEPLGYFFRDGFLIFFRESWRKPILLVETSEANFYPGFALFHTVMRNLVTEVAERSA